MPARIPFKAKPMPELQKQWDKAKETVFDEESCRIGVAMKANETPRCIFDLENGVRLCIGRECLMTGKRVIKFYAIIRTDSPLAQGKETVFMGGITDNEIVRAFYEITQLNQTDDLVFLGVGLNDGAPFWSMPDPYYETR